MSQRLDESSALAKIDMGKRFLAEARDLTEVLKVHDMAIAVMALAIARDAEEAARMAAELKLEAEAKAGVFLKNQIPHKGGRPSENAVTLAGLNVKENESRRWQTIASIPEVERKSYYEDARKHREFPTQNALLELAKDKEAEAKRAEAIEESRKPVPVHQTWLDLTQGDFRDVKVENDSVDMLFTDPPYIKESLELWGSLAKWGARVLKPGAFLLTYAGHYWLPQIIEALSNELQYYWIFALKQTGGQPRLWEKKLWIQWKPILAFSKGPPSNHEWLGDMCQGDPGDKDYHEWAQGEKEAGYFIEAFTKKGGLVLDPMCGSGTILRAAYRLERQFKGIEKDPEKYQIAKGLLSK